MAARGVVRPVKYGFGLSSTSILNFARRIVPKSRGIKLMTAPSKLGKPCT
ncbi:uncharacterized protein METZ01_LOCUS132 [marine metagenome]|uniref:Uncharacterized protein n=1 Tax=marine metagenome TaxID=408172 RepID=A0A381N0S5_9ZZZZ